MKIFKAIFSLSIICTLAAGISSCHHTDSLCPTNIGTWKVESQTYTSGSGLNTRVTFAGYLYLFQTVDCGDYNNTLQIAIGGPLHTGTFPIAKDITGASPDTAGMLISVLEGGIKNIYYAGNGHGGTLNITSVDATNHTFSGTYASEVYNSGSGAVRQVTAGSFNNVAYQ